MEWKTVTAEQFCTRVTDGTHDSPKRQEVGRYLITSKHLSGSDIDFSSAYKISEEDYQKIIVRSNVEQYDILFSMIGTIGNTYRVTEEAVDYAVKNMAIFKFGGNKGDSSWFYYWLKSPQAQAYISQMQAGSTQGYLTLATLRSFPVAVPDHATQDKIVAILSSFDDKIENNNRINCNLEAQAQALFKSWFVDFEPWGGTMPEDWKEDSLTNIADFLNGLAMQKFPAKDIENSLPVLKIKELGQKHCDESSDRCTKEIKPEYIIHDGDVIFSWSGTLLVDIWCGGDCGLNQHLFKLSSNKYPKWFYYLWTIQHLQNFKRIASDKAVTMGHIKRGDLDKSIVLIPNDNVLEKMTAIMTPLLDSIVSKAQESARLATLRDTLLPKLMKGEIEL